MAASNKPDGNGPSYWDVVQHADYLKDQHGVGIRWLLVPASATVSGGNNRSWVVSVEVWTLRTARKQTWNAQASFGYGGSWRTLPAALLATLRAYEAKREDERVAAEAQAAF